MLKLLKYTTYACLMYLFSTGIVFAGGISVTHHNQPNNMLEPESFSTSEVFKTAGVNWLPDWQYVGRSYSSRTEDDNGGSGVVGSCSDYGLTASCASPKVSTGTMTTASGATCQKSCICPSNYQFTSSNCKASEGKVLSGKACEGRYASCSCGSEYKYNSSNCSGDYRLDGASCNGNYTSCFGKSCSEGGYEAAIPDNKKCTTVNYGGNTCYQCSQPSCSDGGYETAKREGYTCSSVSYYGQTCYSCSVDKCYGLEDKSCQFGCKSKYSQCPSKCQTCEGDPCDSRTAVTCRYGCLSYYSDCSSKCETCKTCSPTCASGYQSASCTAGDTAIEWIADSCDNMNQCHKCAIPVCREAGYKLFEEFSKPEPTNGVPAKYYDQNGNLITAALNSDFNSQKLFAYAEKFMELFTIKPAQAALSSSTNSDMSSSVNSNTTLAPALCPSSCRPGDCYNLYHARSECCPCEGLKADPICNKGQMVVNGICVDLPVACIEGYIVVDGKCVEDNTIIRECRLGYTLVNGICVKNEEVIDPDPLPQICTIGFILVDNECVPEPEEYEFVVTDECVHNSKYIKGEWRKK